MEIDFYPQFLQIRDQERYVIKFSKFLLFLVMLTATAVAFAQETTTTLQGTIKDGTGAVIPGATITVTTPSLVGTKATKSDSKGYYRFENLPPGAYVVKVEATGFSTRKQEHVILELGKTPSLDLALAVGSKDTVVEVTSEAPAIDVTSVTTQTNVSQDVISYVPRGTSFQSVIQFAPAASNEPLMGNTMSNGTGSVSPGSGSNGGTFGYSVAGASDSENSYLVEGQETANLIGGYSHTSVPFDFIQDVQITTSGTPAEYGGALGGVVNVIMKKGSSHYHGSVFSQYESTGMEAGPNQYPRYDPTQGPVGGYGDQPYQSYQPVKPHTSFVAPGFTLSGPLVPSGRFTDKIFFFVGFNPQLSRYEEHVNYGPNGGNLPFSSNTNTYYTTARVDAQVTKNIRVFGSWLYQLQRQNGQDLPTADSTQGYLNPVTQCNGSKSTATCGSGFTPTYIYAHNLGYVAPNQTVNTGADITITPHFVSTTHFGYYFENYHDFGFPTTGSIYNFQFSGIFSQGGVTAGTGGGGALPASYQQGAGYLNVPTDQNFTAYNSNKAIQLDQDFSYYKSGWAGTHNFKFGYQLIRSSNTIFQHFNAPYIQVFPGDSSGYSPGTAGGTTNCGLTEAADGTTVCEGKYGFLNVEDYGTKGSVVSYDHGLYLQDSWTVGHGVTLDLGVRDDKEYLTGAAGNVTSNSGASLSNPISFGWGDKVAPRLGGAWDVMQNGKLKLFGSYGVFYDIMKLNVALSSFGGQYWKNCFFTNDNPNLNSIVVNFNAQSQYCTGQAPTSVTNFAGGTTPAGLRFIESTDYRTFPTSCSTCSVNEEGVAPGLKPYTQHEDVFGVDYQLSRTLAFEARYDRRRLDHVIEDSAIASSAGETFVIINPGQGVDATFNGFCTFLYPAAQFPGACTSAGPQPPTKSIAAARSYDGVELRLNKAVSNHWAGMFSYTYSHFRGNYTGLTSSDLSDGDAGGRNAPNNSRAFDEPYFQWDAAGKSSSGLLPTDRPNKLKGYAYYVLPEFHNKLESTFGIFENALQGSPNSSFVQDFGYTAGYDFPVYPFNRGQWVNVSQLQSNPGTITIGSPHVYRNPWYVQTDFNAAQTYKISETMALNFNATFTNLFNEHAVTAVNEQIDSNSSYINQAQLAAPGGYLYYDGIPFYAAAMNGYNLTNVLNNQSYSPTASGAQIINSQYGKPLYYQHPRTIRLQVNFTF